MIFSCNGIELADSLNKVSQALSQRSLSSALESIKIEAVDDNVIFTATDLDFTIIKTIKADVKMSGEVLVQGKLFSEYARSFGDSSVEISDDEDVLKIKYMDNTTSLKLINIESFPPINDYNVKTKIVIKQNEFRKLIEGTAFAASVNDENRPVLKGCNIIIENNEIKLVALDGYRMAECKKVLDEKHDRFEMNIPAKNLLKIAKFLDHDEDDVILSFCDKKFIVEVDGLKTISSPLDGFVNYKNSIPQYFETEITVNKKYLQNAIERVSILTKLDKSNLIRFEVKDNNLYIKSNSEAGESNEVINILNKGKDILVGINSKYILDCLRYIDDECITMKMNFTNPAIISAVEDSDYLYLILPIKLSR